MVPLILGPSDGVWGGGLNWLTRLHVMTQIHCKLGQAPMRRCVSASGGGTYVIISDTQRLSFVWVEAGRSGASHSRL